MQFEVRYVDRLRQMNKGAGSSKKPSPLKLSRHNNKENVMFSEYSAKKDKGKRFIS